MQLLNRRRLFHIAGLGSVALAGVGVPTVGRSLLEKTEKTLRFRATVGLPQAPLPSYATYVVEGMVDPSGQSGVITTRVLAGHPDAQSEIGLPGLGRIIKVVSVAEQGSQLTVRGVIEDRSQLQPGEGAQVELSIDRARGVVQAPLGGRSIVLSLA